METSNVAVTGGLGFIGSHAAAGFAKQGHDVVVLDNESRDAMIGRNRLLKFSRREELAALGNVRVVEGDVRDPGTAAGIVKGADVVVHCAGQVAVTSSLTDPLNDFNVNALGTLNVLEGIRRSGNTPDLIFTSTNKVYGNGVNQIPVAKGKARYRFVGEKYRAGIPETFPVDAPEHSPYGCSKLAADQYVQDYATRLGFRGGVFRMSCIYGPQQSGVEDQGWLAWFAIATHLGMPLTIFGDGRQVRDILHVDDLLRCWNRFLGSKLPAGAHVFNLGGGPRNTISLLELLDELEERTGRSPATSYSDWRDGDQKVYISDIRKCTKALGWSPNIDPPSGIQSLLDWVGQFPQRGA